MLMWGDTKKDCVAEVRNYFLFEKQVGETFNDRVNLHPIEEDVVKAIANIREFLDSWLANRNAIVECFSIVFEGCIYLVYPCCNSTFSCLPEVQA